MRDKRTLYYRYVSRAELKFILRNFYIMSRSGFTYFTYERYDDADRAQKRLALERRPEYRIGPIPEEEMPFIPYKGVVPPTPLFPGGGPGDLHNGAIILGAHARPRISARHLRVQPIW